MVRLVLVLVDQLTPSVAALKAADKTRDVVVMAEVMGEGNAVPHHPQKIALILTSMRKFASALEAEGWRVAYTRLFVWRHAGVGKQGGEFGKVDALGVGFFQDHGQGLF